MPWLAGRGPTRSTWRLKNLVVGGGRSTSEARVCRWILEDWQGWHSLNHFRISRSMPCQTKRWVMACCVGRAPACESPWIWSSTGRVQDLGKTGRVTLVDVPHSKANAPIWMSWSLRPVSAVRLESISTDCTWSWASWSKLLTEKQICSSDSELELMLKREKASATTLNFPVMYWMSVVNSAM